jgi:hypothetical protein
MATHLFPMPTTLILLHNKEKEMPLQFLLIQVEGEVELQLEDHIYLQTYIIQILQLATMIPIDQEELEIRLEKNPDKGPSKMQ